MALFFGAGAPSRHLQQLSPGVSLALVLALSATFVSDHYGGPKYLYALLMGMAFHHLSSVDRYTPGIEFAAKKLVRIGVALLGLRILVGDLHDLGVFGALALATGLVATIFFGIWCAGRLGLPKSLGILSGGGTGICGISATLAISATLPQTEEVEQMTLLTAIGIAAFSTLAMVTYPLIVASFGLTTNEAGFMLGGAIHDVAQVVGAGYIISPDVADFATLTKMFRVAMLMPVVVAMAMIFRSNQPCRQGLIHASHAGISAGVYRAGGFEQHGRAATFSSKHPHGLIGLVLGRLDRRARRQDLAGKIIQIRLATHRPVHL